jgi:hypothetical protein
MGRLPPPLQPLRRQLRSHRVRPPPPVLQLVPLLQPRFPLANRWPLPQLQELPRLWHSPPRRHQRQLLLRAPQPLLLSHQARLP